MEAQREVSTHVLTVQDSAIETLEDVAWFDERPQCKHLQACCRAGEDTGERCDSYGRSRPGYCPINGGTCAMEDPDWVFDPGWDTWAEWAGQGHEYITMDVWPGLKAGDLAAYVVDGDCMAPTWNDGELCVVRTGNSFQNGDACVISRRAQRIPPKGKLAYLKRLERIGSKLLQIRADNPTYEPFLMPVDAVRIRGVALEGVAAADVRDQLVTCHTFVDGRIEPQLWTASTF